MTHANVTTDVPQNVALVGERTSFVTVSASLLQYVPYYNELPTSLCLIVSNEVPNTKLPLAAAVLDDPYGWLMMNT